MSAIGMTPDFWAGRRVFMTGHTGFMGGWLALWLARLGAKVSGYALTPPTEPNLFTAAGVDRDVSSTVADVRDLARLTAAMTAADPEVVMHLAAQPLVRKAYADPVETYATNVMGTVNVLEAMRACPSVRAAVIVTTDKVYDNIERDSGYRETDALGGREPYGNSKACAEFVVRSFRDSYFNGSGGNGGTLGIATARAGNVIGGGDWAAERIVPDAVRAFSSGRTLAVRNPGATRPWQHVLEPLKGYLMLAQRLSEGPEEWSGGWNFGPPESESRPVSWLADELVTLWGDGARWRADGADGVYEARLLAIEIEKAEKQLGWRPVWGADRAAARTVEWYKAHDAGKDVRALTHAQIEAYADDC